MGAIHRVVICSSLLLCLLHFLLAVVHLQLYQLWNLPGESEENDEYTISSVRYVEQSAEELENLVKLGLTPRDPLEVTYGSSGKAHKIHGRFLHITDMHPDEYYKENSNIDEACHHGKSKDEVNRASKFGDAIKGCDAPVIMVNQTLQWISDNLKDKIDFVVWTGDNIRHDNDRRYPRLETDIFDMNEKVADWMHNTFLDDDSTERVKVIPSLGNNDVYPHNLFAPGPTLQTRELYKIWNKFVPSEQLHVFARGAYFFKEIFPGKLAVLSINTLYLFRSNPLVDNCDSRKEPGYKLFQWLGVVLEELRSRNMKVWITGHVPPTPKNYDPTCLRKQVVWLYEYRDIIIGSLFGHMNIDHFIPLDSQKAYKSINKKLKKLGLEDDYFEVDTYEESDDEEYDDSGDFTDMEEFNSYLNITVDDEIFSSEAQVMAGAPYAKVDYMDLIRDSFYSRVKGKKKRGKNSERYAIAHISVSVVPTFNPGFRVWEYNITELYESGEVASRQAVHQSWDAFFEKLEQEVFNDEEFQAVDLNEGLDDYDSPFMTEEKLVSILKKDKTLPPKMPADLALGPAYTPQLFSPQRYAQYYVDLDTFNKKNTEEFSYELEYTTDDDSYNLNSLLVDDWVNFAQKLGEPVKTKRQEKAKKNVSTDTKREQKLNKLWKNFLKRSFIDTGYEDMGDYN